MGKLMILVNDCIYCERDDLKAKLDRVASMYSAEVENGRLLGDRAITAEQQLQRAREALKKYGRHIGTGDCWVGLNSHGGTPECSCGYADALRDIEAGK